ncbi:hypothetical protein MRB53_032761 [Persea americana]|uniref:Uncharacterized protein n=1 Tax=Persea americana TaxID=3435 RepID=A0ACC2KTM8_PERAE|nr:hypothetical protein MRB53_032761 [Persea americana]
MTAIKYIKFDGCHNNKDIFRSLRHLVLHTLSNLERWSSQQENGDGDEQRREEDKQVILGCLCRLRIHDCPKLIRLPKLLLPALEFLEMNGVGCDRIDLPMSKSVKKFELRDVPNLERWSFPEEVILCFLKIFNCPKLMRLPKLLLPALEFLEMNRVGCERIDLPMSKSLKKFVLRDMPNLERLSFPEVDDDEDGQVILRFFHTLKIFNCPKLIRLLKLLLPALEFLEMNGVGCDRIDLPMSKSLKEVKLEHMPNLESWSSREVDGDEDDQVILRFFCTLDIFDCP